VTLLESQLAEIKAFDVFHGTRLLQRRWKLLVVASVAATTAAVVATFFVSPIWESEVNIQLGVVNGEILEDPRILSRIIESDAVGQAAPGTNDSSRLRLRAQVVDITPGGPVAYLRVLARGRTPDEARARAAYALEFAKRRHAELSQEALNHSQEYQQTLAATVKQLGESIAKLESIVVSLKSNIRDESLAAVLYQAQLEAKRTQHVQLSKELRDWKMKDALSTRYTREVGPPSTPQNPIWPRPSGFAVVGGGIGFVLAAIGVLLFGR
jgi:uncharacterized protein involved in exopolysaccharide biosynthesis